MSLVHEHFNFKLGRRRKYCIYMVDSDVVFIYLPDGTRLGIHSDDTRIPSILASSRRFQRTLASRRQAHREMWDGI